MIPANKKWIKSMAPNLLRHIKQTMAPREYERTLHELRMDHEADPVGRPGDEISIRYYQTQRDLIDPGAEMPVRLCVIGGTDGGRAVIGVKAKHLIIVEPDLNSFLWSLELVNWPERMAYQKKIGGTLYLHLGGFSNSVTDSICKQIMTIGLFNGSTMHYRHDGTKEGAHAVEVVSECLQACINTLGFYDDERVGLAHAIHRLHHGASFLSRLSEPYIDRPVVVCGNGPSLANNIDEIRAKRDQIWLVSCGSTIGTLFNHGIKPDWHIDQERPKVTSNWTKLRTTPEFRDGIQFIGLHVVHPQNDALFKDAVYVAKNNDAGLALIGRYIDNLPVPHFVLPQVGNAGVAIMAELGFKHIYLAGIDCASAHDGASHPEWYKGIGDIECTIEVDGNFREKVKTKALWVESIENFERLIGAKSEVRFFNLSDGAKIGGAMPAHNICLFAGETGSKEMIRAMFVKSSVEFDMSAFHLEMIADMQAFREAVNGKDLDGIHHELRKLMDGNRVLWHLLKGTVSTQLVLMAGITKPERFTNFHAMLGDIQVDIERNLFNFCHWESDNGLLPDDVNNPPA